MTINKSPGSTSPASDVSPRRVVPRRFTIGWYRRIVTLVGVYDALISARVYKGGLPHDEVVKMIVAGRGTQFDPDVVDAFPKVHGEWRRIAKEFADDHEEPDARAGSTEAPSPRL